MNDGWHCHFRSLRHSHGAYPRWSYSQDSLSMYAAMAAQDVSAGTAEVVYIFPAEPAVRNRIVERGWRGHRNTMLGDADAEIVGVGLETAAADGDSVAGLAAVAAAESRMWTAGQKSDHLGLGRPALKAACPDMTSLYQLRTLLLVGGGILARRSFMLPLRTMSQLCLLSRSSSASSAGQEFAWHPCPRVALVVRRASRWDGDFEAFGFKDRELESQSADAGTPTVRITTRPTLTCLFRPGYVSTWCSYPEAL